MRPTLSTIFFIIIGIGILEVATSSSIPNSNDKGKTEDNINDAQIKSNSVKDVLSRAESDADRLADPIHVKLAADNDVNSVGENDKDEPKTCVISVQKVEEVRGKCVSLRGSVHGCQTPEYLDPFNDECT